MEANIFQEIHDALQNRSNRLQLPLQYACPIQKVVWSSFNFMVGPELRFVWEAKYEEAAGSGDESSSDGNFPSTSSDVKVWFRSNRSTRAVQSAQGSGFQYDELLNVVLEATHYASDEERNNFEASHESGNSQAGASTLCSSSAPNGGSTPRQEKENVGPTAEGGSDDDQSSYTNVSETENRESASRNDTKLTTSIVDSGIAGTVSVHSDLSESCRSPKVAHQDVEERLSQSSSEKSDYGYCDNVEQQEDGRSDTEQTVVQAIDGQATAAFLTTSHMLTEMSAVGGKMSDSLTKSVLLENEGPTLKGLVDDAPPLTDELFITKFALAEQISSSCLDINPLVCKIAVVPHRQLLVYSYLFEIPSSEEKKPMALTVVMPEDSLDWLGPRENCLEEMIEDIVSRFKASYMAEELDDFICRVTGDISEALKTLGTLNRHQLPSTVDVKSTMLNDVDLNRIDKLFLSKAITGCVVANGNCVLLGADPAYVTKFASTLSLFLTPDERKLCMKPHVFHYSPYLKLQAIKRDMAEDLYVSAVESHWPTCFIDVDRMFVTYSGNYFVHHNRKSSLTLFQMGKIFTEAGHDLTEKDQNISRREPIVEPVPVDADPMMARRIEALFSTDEADRIEFVDQINLALDQQGLALTEVVKEISEPSKTSKDNAVSSRWSLSTVRKMLNLVNDTAFGMALARAERIKPRFAQFILQCAAQFR